VDVLSARAYGGFAKGRTAVLPPSVAAIECILGENDTRLEQMTEIAIIGKGALVGKPTATWALQQGFARVSVYDKGFNPANLATADIIISGTGSPKIFSQAHVKNGALIIDFGFSKEGNGRIV